MPNLVVADETLTAKADGWLRRVLGVRSLDTKDVLSRLRDPGLDSSGFYTWLVKWADGQPRHKRDRFVQALADVACVHTATGGWVTPASGVFFPRERQADVLPVEVPIQIADLPDVAGLRTLMTEAGVNPFRWREILVHHVLPLLTSQQTSAELRQRGHGLLRAYRNSEDHGDQDVLKRLGDVLLLARDVTGTRCSLQPARLIYLGEPWAATGELELLYGTFDKCEFLAEPVGDDQDTYDQDLAYWLWLGVQTRPMVRVAADSSARYRLEDLPGNSFARQENLGPRWGQWARGAALRAAYACGQNHPASQHLTPSAIDRLCELVSCGDVERLRLLGAALSRDWDHYQAVLNTTIRCVHQDHRGTRERSVASMTMDVLAESAWLPAVCDRSVVIRPPGEVWLRAVGLPAAVRRRLTFLDSQLDTAETAHVWTALGVADSARPAAAHLIRLLRKLAAEQVADADVADVARWAMRQLNDALADGAGTRQILQSDVPLLAVLGGKLIFHPRPYVVDDHVLKEIWGDLYPILAADAGLSSLTQWLNLPRLADLVRFEPSVGDRLPQESIDLRRELTEALPYLAAVAIAAAPSRQDRIRGRLQHVEVIACRRLELTSTVDEHTRHHPVAAYAHRQRDAEGKPNTVVYLQLDAQTSTPDWYALGPRLADLLDMPAHADALTLLLAADPSQREAYLRSRGIAPPDHTPDEIDEEPEVEPLTDIRPSPAASPPVDTGTKPAIPAQIRPPTPRSPTTAGPGEQLPPLDNTVYRMSEAASAMADNANGKGEANSGVETGLPLPAAREPSANRASPDNGHDDLRTADDLKLAREYGKRGEEWAYLQERQRLRQRGLDPDRAVWVSRSNESANHDLRSIDDDGEEIFIEVKATSSADPTARFEITGNELAMAHRYQHRYFIYHVLEVRSPTPVVIRYRDPLGLVAQGLGQIHTSRAHMHLDVPGVEVLIAHPQA